MNKDQYFIILQLPVFRGVGPVSCPQAGFLQKALSAIRKGRASIVSKRADTGVSEELRAHASGTKRFTNYLLIQLYLDKEDHSDSVILDKVAASLLSVADATVVELADRFCLCAV